MHAFPLLLLVVVLQISGTFGFHHVENFDREVWIEKKTPRRRRWQDTPIDLWDLPNYNAYQRHRFWSAKHISNYTDLPSLWVSSKRNPADKFRSQALLRKVFPKSVSSKKPGFLDILPIERRMGLFLPKSHQTVVDNSNLDSSILSKANNEINKNGSFPVLQPNYTVSTQTTYDDNNVDKITTISVRSNTPDWDIAFQENSTEDIYVEIEATEITATLEETGETSGIKEKATENIKHPDFGEGTNTILMVEEVVENKIDNSSSNDETLPSSSISAPKVLGTSPGTTFKTSDSPRISILDETTPSIIEKTPVDASRFEGITTEINDRISTTVFASTSKITGASFIYSSTNQKSLTSDMGTEAVSATHERVIDFPRIRTAKIILSSVFLAIGLIAIAVIAALIFKEKRKSLKYDQLTLLP